MKTKTIKLCNEPFNNSKMERNDYETLRKSVFNGDTVRIKQGVYCKIEDIDLVNYEIEKVVPGGIMCMWSAWYYYDLCDIIPNGTCVAVSVHRKVKTPEFPRYDLYYRSEKSLNCGITTQTYNGIEFKIYDIERCVCDAVRFRNKISKTVVADIVKNYVSRKNKDMKKLHQYAKLFGVEKYLKNILFYIQ